MDIKFFNVIILGLGFFFVFTAFFTGANIQKVVLDSITKDDPTFTGEGYTSLAIVYAVFSICNWLAPSTLLITGTKGALMLGSSMYCIFIASFLYPKTWLLYTVSALVGAGAAMIWAGQGVYLAKSSDSTTITRNSGLFLALMQSSTLFGNLFVFYQFQGETHIGEGTRQIVFSVLFAVGIIGVILFATLKNERHFNHASTHNLDVVDSAKESLLTRIAQEFNSAVKLFLTRNMLLLTSSFFYIGLVTSFFNVYSSSVGFTLAFGESKKLVGLCGLFIGVGEVLGGVGFGILGKRTVRFGRNPVVIVGFLVHLLAFVLIHLSLPDVSTLGDTTETSYFDQPSPVVALFCAFCLGLGDACFNTQFYSLLGADYVSQSAGAFAIFRFFLSVGAAVSFVYSSYCGLTINIVIMVIVGLMGTVGFCVVERALQRKKSNNTEVE